MQKQLPIITKLVDSGVSKKRTQIEADVLPTQNTSIQ